MAEPIPPPPTAAEAAAPTTGKVVMRSGDGRLYQVDPADVAIQERDQGWAVAGDAEVQARVAERTQYAQYGSTGQQALGQAERFARTATLGLVQGAGSPEDIAGRQALTRQESPVTSFLTQAAGTAVPAIAGGALVEGAAGALGVGRAAAGIGPLLPEAAATAATGESLVGAAGALVEGGASGTADEVEEAQAQQRGVNAGNILMYGVGGEILGRAVPAVLRKGASAFRNRLTGEVAEEAGEHVLAGAERRALDSAADVADGVPLGPDRDAFLVGAEKNIIDTGSQRAAAGLDTLNQTMAEVTGSGAKRNKIRAMVPETNPAQRQWAADTSQAALDLRAELRPKGPGPSRGVSPISLEGRTLEDLKALPIEGEGDLARVEALKQNKAFSETGRVTSNDGKQGVTLVNDGGELLLRDGRHRLQAAQELGRETVYGRYVDGESGKVLFEGEIPLKGGAPAEATPLAYSQVKGLRKPAADLDRILKESSERLDTAAKGADWFEAAGELEQSLHAQETKLRKIASAADPLDQGAAQELLGKVSDYRKQLRLDRERPDLWGDAGDLQKGLNTALEDHWRPGSDVVDSQFGTLAGENVRTDPSKLRGHLSADEVGRGVTPEFLEKKLQGAEQAIGTHRKYGTASEQQLSRMQGAVDSVREQLRLADDVRGAKARASERAGVAKESARFDAEQAGALREQSRAEERAASAASAKDELVSGALGAVAGMAAHSMGLGAVVALGAKALRMSRLVDTLGRTGQAAIGSAARGAIRGSAARALRAAEGALAGRAASGAVTATASTAIARFQGEYPTVQSAFAAKARTLTAIANDPLALHRATAQALGGIDHVNPQLHGEVSARLMQVASYLHDNLPAQLSASMTRPNGIPLSRATARDFALKYNSVTNPASVLEDVRDGTASPTQLRALEAVHPDIYQSLRIELARQVSEQPQMTTQRKLRLDILFGGDGMAGRAFGWGLARAIQGHRASIATGAVGQSMAGGSVAKNAPQARSTSAIASSVTNG